MTTAPLPNWDRENLGGQSKGSFRPTRGAEWDAGELQVGEAEFRRKLPFIGDGAKWSRFEFWERSDECDFRRPRTRRPRPHSDLPRFRTFQIVCWSSSPASGDSSPRNANLQGPFGFPRKRPLGEALWSFRKSPWWPSALHSLLTRSQFRSPEGSRLYRALQDPTRIYKTRQDSTTLYKTLQRHSPAHASAEGRRRQCRSYQALLRPPDTLCSCRGAHFGSARCECGQTFPSGGPGEPGP
jgi:hypothetical protein